ncbi:MAG: hypothetical protein J6M17_10385 [Ruminococcus sp.]|nr:hypothetical protein [Ruminococcus sp.]MBP3272614.1 hypothetical protein [Ruminococcus sp.]
MAQHLIFGSEQVATPVTISYANEKIWSKNAGRTASCVMVGDIIAIKKTIHIEWAHLTPEQVTQINSYISSMSRPFFAITILDEEFKTVTKTVYSGTPTYEQWGWDEKRQLCKLVAVDLIEQ